MQKHISAKSDKLFLEKNLGHAHPALFLSMGYVIKVADLVVLIAQEVYVLKANVYSVSPVIFGEKIIFAIKNAELVIAQEVHRVLMVDV